jgi:uncharacterized alpha-E superfamily protein
MADQAPKQIDANWLILDICEAKARAQGIAEQVRGRVTPETEREIEQCLIKLEEAEMRARKADALFDEMMPIYEQNNG